MGLKIYFVILPLGQSRWSSGVKRGSATARLLDLWVRIPPGTWMSVVSVVCCHVKVSASLWSLVQTSPTDSRDSECDCEAWTMRRAWSTRCCCNMEKGLGCWSYAFSLFKRLELDYMFIKCDIIQFP